MPSTNDALSAILSPKKIWIYSDGGASTVGQKTGAYAAMILFPDGTQKMVAGACSWTKNNRMELQALCAALYYIRTIHLNGITHGVDIQILTDSEVTMNGALAKPKDLDSLRFEVPGLDTILDLHPILAPSLRRFLNIPRDGRHSNLDLWACFDELVRHFDDVAITHTPRNTEPQQAQADAVCHFVRAAFAQQIDHIVAHPDFASCGITRSTKFPQPAPCPKETTPQPV